MENRPRTVPDGVRESVVKNNMLITAALGTINEIVASLVYLVLYLAHYMVTITGALRHIHQPDAQHKSFVDKTRCIWSGRPYATYQGYSSYSCCYNASFMMILDQPSKATGSVAN